MAVGAAPSAPPPGPPAQDDRVIRTWRADPDRYVRRVKGGRYQARPYDPETRTRVNLGTFGTPGQARGAVQKYWWGELAAKPKFVRASRNQYSFGRGDPVRYFVLIPTAAPGAGGDRKRSYQRVGDWFATEAQAVAARDAFLEATYGRLVAKAMLSRADTSRRAGKY
ncbi:hypothetical protein GobsT_63450 [Gemmata obscuriglobus]|uniref:AP2/ERF domain-containing protein n=1 Tax=Gemmata obscuriglobus TaxID=114 RepID=A0A2Z3GQ28_9BACT|nr:hypothetical protein [Gemmata obscuriglobus]AWM35923.1 hypothetical protein C1280_02110 [Gemmata obscuriglobus]QEG31523.1 hypothetical protein GobsT_63450 [Gemmata obscuriglobus]VTS10865.1 hypothetical protein : [Gemmata obscuriglobus UQM 2246]